VVGGSERRKSGRELHSCKPHNRISTGLEAETRLGEARTVTLEGAEAACLM